VEEVGDTLDGEHVGIITLKVGILDGVHVGDSVRDSVGYTVVGILD
jgi:hypothetical protein